MESETIQSPSKSEHSLPIADVKQHQNLGLIEKLATASEILPTLECQMCQEVPLPPISSCENGHNVCNFCRSKLLICSLCRGKFIVDRNWAIESIINSSTFRCINSTIGCPQILKGDEHADHLKSCEHR